jgi:hypothetical protein
MFASYDRALALMDPFFNALVARDLPTAQRASVPTWLERVGRQTGPPRLSAQRFVPGTTIRALKHG